MLCGVCIMLVALYCELLAKLMYNVGTMIVDKSLDEMREIITGSYK